MNGDSPLLEVHRLVRSRRRSLALMITDEAKLVVRAPFHLPERDIHAFIAKQRRWIERKVREVAARPKPSALTAEQERELKERAVRVIPERVKHFAAITGFTPDRVRVSNARGRWGSCGVKGTINISWRLTLAPQEILDYVIVHELCHLAERNHSRRFWRLVEQFVPDHRARRRWLRSAGLS